MTEREGPQNRLQRRLALLRHLPGRLNRRLRNWMVGRAIPFVGAAGIEFLELDARRVVAHLADRRRVRNHIGGVHAAAAALLAETATGLALGMHVPDDKLPLLKSMHVRYVRRAQGGLTATAQLADEQIAALHREERGEVNIAVTLRDAEQEETAIVEMIWAWIPRKQKGAAITAPSDDPAQL